MHLASPIQGKDNVSFRASSSEMSENTATRRPPGWFAKEPEEVLRELRSGIGGLSQEEAKRRLAEHGPNEVPREKPKGPLYYLLRQINQPLIYVLLVSSAITSYLQEWIDTAVILVVVATNAMIGFLQERKAGEAISELLKYEVAYVKVKRDGHQVMLPATELVPGDVIMLQAGDMVPADVRFVFVKDVYVDESLLTGESQGVLKQTEAIPRENLVPADMTNMGFSGTFVVRGRGEAVVVATGAEMEIGRISKEISEEREEAFPLMKKVSKFSQYLSIGIALAAVLTFALGLVRDYEAVYMFRASVALAVAAIPEGLPAMLTVAMAMGVRAMAKRQAIVRSLPAVEALGSTTVICSDKTGTLTMNRMVVERGFIGRKEFEADIPRYTCLRHCDAPGPADVEREPELATALAIATLCNDAVVRDGRAEGDPTEVALKSAASAAGVVPAMLRLDEIPFETSLGYMATLNKGDGENLIMVKGAPERVLPRCTAELVGGKEVKIDKSLLDSELDQMASKALRVLGLAQRRMPEDFVRLEQKDIRNLTFVGLIGLRDPPRPEAKDAVQACKSAEIRVVMITGDHKSTALSIGADLGIASPDGRVVTGEEIEAMDEAAFDSAVDKTNIFARTTPEHKYRIVKRLREKGHVVAVTGDGVNDTPALKASNIGVAMGVSGTDAAKASADIVLKDDNFATIVAAVEEGRDVYSKLQKIIAWTIPTNIGQAMMLFTAILLGAVLPLLPLQILWVNLATAITLAIPLAFEAREQGLLLRPPIPPGQPIVTRAIARKFVIVSSLMVLGTYGIFVHYVAEGASEALSRTVALNTLVFFQMFYLLSGRSLTEPAWSTSLRSNPWIVAGIAVCLALQVTVTYFGPMNFAFATTAISLRDWLVSAAIASSVFFVIETEKAIVRLSRSRRGVSPSGSQNA